MSPESKIWIYQADRILSDLEAEMVARNASTFAAQWVSHNNQLSATGECFHNLFLVLTVDESMAGASGCSIDKSVHFVKNLEETLNVSFFNRLNFSFVDENKNVQIVDKQTFKKHYQEQKINNNTIVFDTLVKNKMEFESSFTKKLEQSWHKRMV